jgi:hypothetical protein
MVQAADFTVGQEVVLCFSKGTPIFCNSANNSQHPCRVKVSRVGRKRVYIQIGGTQFQPVGLDFSEKYHTIVPVEQAKIDYREALEAREVEVRAKYSRNILTPAQIDQNVASL